MTCIRCALGKYAKKRVRFRGDPAPVDILFIGEAPGKSEDMLGKPFVGRAGRLLEQAIKQVGIPFTYRITNTVQCRPTDSKYGDTREPTDEEIWACRANLMKIYTDSQPKLVVFLGSISRRTYSKVFLGAQHLLHPAFILRRGGVQATEFREFIAGLEMAVRTAKEIGQWKDIHPKKTESRSPSCATFKPAGSDVDGYSKGGSPRKKRRPSR